MRTIKVLGRSLLVSYFLSALLLTILALALFQMKLSPSSVAGGVYAVYGVSCFIGGVLTGKGSGSRRFFWGLCSGLLYFLVLALMSFLLNGSLGQSAAGQDSAKLPLVLGICAASGTIGGMIS